MSVFKEICSIFDVRIRVTSLSEAVEKLMKEKAQLEKGYFCFTNVHTLVMAYEDNNYKKVQNESLASFPDGKPLVLIEKLKGCKNAERVCGPDFMGELLERTQHLGWRHYFYGSTPETLEKLRKNLNKKYPELTISGCYSPPFRNLSEQEELKIIDMINASSSDCIWIGLGAPKQEVWMNRHKDKISGLMFGVGAAFDFFAGTTKRAPKWMQKCYLEWFYRLLQEPKRLMGRYLKTNLKFMCLAVKELFGKKK